MDTYHEEICALGAFPGFVPTILFAGLLLWMSHGAGSGGGAGGGIFDIGKSSVKISDEDTDVDVKLKDVAGAIRPKRILWNSGFLSYDTPGAEIPRGALLSGSLGTGKTLPAKFTVGETSHPRPSPARSSLRCSSV